MTNYCSMTGKPIHGPSDAIWEDGEWVSWEWINGQLYEQELEGQYPKADLEVAKVFEDLVDVAIEYKHITGRYLSIFGELGELFAEITFGIQRHKPGTPGSDGRIGNDWVEVKTITPEKKNENVFVKRAGNFNKLVVVKISEDFEFEARMLDRSEMAKGKGKLAKISWSSMKPLKSDSRGSKGSGSKGSELFDPQQNLAKHLQGFI